MTFAKKSRSSLGVPSLHGLLHHIKDMFMGFIAYQGPYKVIIIIQELHDPTRVARSLHHQVWVQGLLQVFFMKQEASLTWQGASWASSTTSTIPGDFQGSRSIMTSPVGLLGLLLGFHDTIRAWMTIEWVINASPTHLGLLHSLQGFQDHLQGLQHHQQGLQHFLQGGGINIMSCGYRDLVNWVQGASRHKPTL